MNIISYLKFRYKLIFRVDHIEINKTDTSHSSKYIVGSFLGTSNKDFEK